MRRHRAIQRKPPRAAGDVGADPIVDECLHRLVAREHVGLLEPRERGGDRRRAQFRMQRRLVVGFETVRHHDMARPATISRNTLALSWWIVTWARLKLARANASL